MKSFLLTMLLFAVVIAGTSMIAVAEDETPYTTSVKLLKFVDGAVVCYVPSNRSGIDCVKVGE